MFVNALKFFGWHETRLSSTAVELGERVVVSGFQGAREFFGVDLHLNEQPLPQQRCMGGDFYV